MYSTSLKNAPFRSFRGVNGNQIKLNEKSDAGGKEFQSRVIEFELKTDYQLVNAWIDVPALLTIIFFWLNNCFVNFIAFTIIFFCLRCKSILSSVKGDTLLVVESVGVQIIGTRVLACLESNNFLPWNTVRDVFINEVITGVIINHWRHKEQIYHSYQLEFHC